MQAHKQPIFLYQPRNHPTQIVDPFRLPWTSTQTAFPREPLLPDFNQRRKPNPVSDFNAPAAQQAIREEHPRPGGAGDGAALIRPGARPRPPFFRRTDRVCLSAAVSRYRIRQVNVLMDLHRGGRAGLGSI